MYAWSFLLGATLLHSAAVAVAPPIRTDDVTLQGPYVARFQRDHVKFDTVQQVLIAYRNASDRAEPAVVWAKADRGLVGLINPLKDFPKADRLDIWDVAAGPESVVIAGVVQAGEQRLHRPPRHVVLTYGLGGVLRAVWVVNPFHHHKIAVDQWGNVYCLGHRIDPVRPLNVVIKYSPNGAIEREFFLSRLLPGGADAVMLDGRIGDNQFWLDGERLMVYIAKLQELFQFDVEGKLQRRVSLEAALTRLARDHGGERAQIVKLATEARSASLLTQLHIRSAPIPSALVRLPLDGGPPSSVEAADGSELGTLDVPLLGRSGDSTLFLNKYTATILRR
jgi:hypothetical protein